MRKYSLEAKSEKRHRQGGIPPRREKAKNYKNFYHIDVYRIRSQKEITALGFKKILADSQNIVLIEWADKIKKILPKSTIWVEFSHGRKENERLIAY